MDVVGVGGGGFAGSKLGVFLGGMVGGPVGVAVGSVLGAVGGATVAKFVSSNVKAAEYQKAIKNLNESLGTMTQRLLWVIDKKMGALYEKSIKVDRNLGISTNNFLVPDRQYVIARYIKRKIRKKIKELQSLKNELHTLANQRIDKDEISPAGLKSYKLVLDGGFFHPSFNQDIINVNKAIDEAEKERKKLGG